MRCDRARRLLSAAFDGDDRAAADVAPHARTCPACAAYGARLTELRHRLRFEPVGRVPDVAPAVLERIAPGAPALPALPAAASRRQAPPRRRSLGWATAAAFTAAAVVGAVVVGADSRRPPTVAADDIPALVLAAQGRLETLDARVTVVERGWHTAVPVRRYAGTLRYRAPESLAIELRDGTAYPPGRWPANDVDLVVDGDRSWSSGYAACPTDSLPECLGFQPRRVATVRREPFPDVDPAPLELALPVRGFGQEGPRGVLGATTVDGRPVLRVATTVAQVADLMRGFLQAGTWRELHPSDRVELHLDRELMVPLGFSVTPGEGSDRARWAVERGYDDGAGDVLLELRLHDARFNEPLPKGSFPPAVEGALVHDSGFVDAGSPPNGLPEPAWLPAGMGAHRFGTVDDPAGPAVVSGTWTDGRGWVKVRATTEWPGDRLFGDPGQIVRRVDLGGAGVAYVGGGGSRVALHGSGIDVAVTGTIGEEALLRVTRSLSVVGRRVPSGWEEASTATLAGARDALPGLLLPDVAPEEPAVRIRGGVVTLAFPGPGDRAYVLVQAAGTSLGPPLEPDVRSVRVRGTRARYSALLGTLEWVEGGRVVSLGSDGLSLAELAAVAEGLERT